MNIHEKCHEINEDARDDLFYSIHFFKTKLYDKFLVSLDLIEDAQTAIDEYNALPKEIFSKKTTLFIYGLLQAVYLQQDGLFSLFKSIKPESKTTHKTFWAEHGKNAAVYRELRNDIAGHPTNRNGGQRFYFLNRFGSGKYEICYYSYSPENTQEFTTDLRVMIEEQKKFTEDILIQVHNEIHNKVNMHKAKFKKSL